MNGHVHGHTRRRFLAQAAALGGVALAGHVDVVNALAAQASRSTRWQDRLGLQTFTVRDKLAMDFEGTLRQVAEAGYKEVEFAGSLGERTPQQVRAILDRVGLRAVSTHIALAPGPDLERQLEAWQIIGHQYTAVRAGGGGRGAAAPPNTADTWRRQAAALNQVGSAGKKYGIRALLHNHVNEFAPLEGTAGTGYDLLLAETDTSLVSMELDIGWAIIAGQDVLGMFRKNPGRYHLWHVKDATGLAAAKALPIQERQPTANFVPVGAGDVDYRTIFAAAGTAGLQHFFVEQDNATQGDSVAAVRTSAQTLRRILS